MTSAQQRDTGCKKQHMRIGTNMEIDGWSWASFQSDNPHEHPGAEICQEDTEQTAGGCKQQRLGHSLTHQPESTGAKGNSQRHFMFPRCSPRHQHTGQIGTSAEQ